jgi:hypothetical protein
LSLVCRAAVTATAVIALEISATGLATADDPIVVTPGGYGGVETVVTDPGSDGSAAQVGYGGSGGGPRCTYTPDDGIGAGDDAPVVFQNTSNLEEGQGQWYTKVCPDGTAQLVWIPSAGDPNAGPVVTPALLAQQAYNRLRLPLPQPEFNPKRSSSAGAATLVTIPTWFWVEDWSGASQRTRAGGVWAEVTAEPVATEWFPGDGSPSVRCAGAGVPWREGMDEDDSSCRYAYTRSSANAPSNRYTGRVMVTWRVTWRGSGGSGGALPLMTREASFPIAVMERQTVVVSGEGSSS